MLAVVPLYGRNPPGARISLTESTPRRARHKYGLSSCAPSHPCCKLSSQSGKRFAIVITRVENNDAEPWVCRMRAAVAGIRRRDFRAREDRQPKEDGGIGPCRHRRIEPSAPRGNRETRCRTTADERARGHTRGERWLGEGLAGRHFIRCRTSRQGFVNSWSFITKMTASSLLFKIELLSDGLLALIRTSNRTRLNRSNTQPAPHEASWRAGRIRRG